MIHAFALEPEVVAGWAKLAEFRFIQDKFGLGTPRALFEFQAFKKWCRAVLAAANELNLSDLDQTRLTALFKLFAEHKYRRPEAQYDGLLDWLSNAEAEYQRREFAGIIASSNPRRLAHVLNPSQLDSSVPRWAVESRVSLERNAASFASTISSLLKNATQIHLVDQHFGPENERHRRVVEALLNELRDETRFPLVRIHCKHKSLLSFFETEAAKFASRLPFGIRIEFVRWKEQSSNDELHNRYILTDLGGVMFGNGFDENRHTQSDDAFLLSADQFRKRWEQYVNETGFDCGDRPTPIVGTRRSQTSKR